MATKRAMDKVAEFEERKKNEYWNHWIEFIFVSELQARPHGATGAKLVKIKSHIWRDKDFWFDILDRHDGMYSTPEQMRNNDNAIYLHMIGNFSGMVYQSLIQSGLIKITR